MATITPIEESRAGWQEVLLSFAPAEKRTVDTRAWLTSLRLPLILLVQAILTWRLNDIVNDDEALYIRTGQAVLSNMLHSGAGNISLLHYDGTYLSGAPNAYPVIAAALNGTGGLFLVRFFSLCCMLTATLCVHSIARYFTTERAALSSSLVFALSGSVLFMGKLATYDAPCLMLIALAACVAITRGSLATGVVIGCLLAVAATTKYAGASLIPFVLLFVLLSDGYRKAVARAGLALLTTCGLLFAGYREWGGAISKGISFTTTARKALDWGSYSMLFESVTWDIGLVLLLAVIGTAVLTARRSWRLVAFSVTCLAGGSILPASQIRIHEFTSLDKHTAFSALFFTLPAGIAVDWALSLRAWGKIAICVVLWMLVLQGLWRSDIQYSWPTSELKTSAALMRNPIPGRYISTNGDSQGYYSTDGIDWEPSSFAYSLFASVPNTLSAAKSKQFAGFVYDTGQNKYPGQRALEKFLPTDRHYRLLAVIRVDQYQHWRWYVWQRVSH